MRRVGVIGYDPRHLVIHASSGRRVSDAWQGSGDVTYHGIYHYHDQADGNYPSTTTTQWYGMAQTSTVSAWQFLELHFPQSCVEFQPGRREI
jgi:hypothetical protein